MPQEEKDRILRLVKHIHSNTGHGSMKNLLEALKRRGVSDAVLEVARQFECPVCEERKRAAPRRPASLETLPQKWQVIQSDLGSWQHPITKHKIKFILFIDEGCRFRVGKILFEDSRQQATWPVVQQCFEEIWLPVFGKPEVIRVDPEGVWRGRDAEAYCQEREIELSPVPAEAHWQVGVIENAIKSQKHVMSSLAQEFPEMSLHECFAKALWACNSRDNYVGYSPAQHALGRNPDEWGKLFETKIDGYPIHPQQMVDGGFQETIKAMGIAEKSFIEFQVKSRLARAEAAGQRPLKSFHPGDLVFFWRKQVPGGGDKGFSWNGQFVGPARVLAVETRQDADGKLRPGSCVWLHRGGRLIKAAPEQLRPASSREVAIEQLKGPVEIPWTITSLATHPHRKTYQDITQDIPTDMQWEEAANHPTGGKRFYGKRSLDKPDVQPATSRPKPESLDTDLIAAHNLVASEQRDSCFCVELAIGLPESKRGLSKFLENPEAFVVGQMKRKAVEVSERHLNDRVLDAFRQAKGKEVRSYIQSHCFKVLSPEQQQKAGSAVGMRWVLTWKASQDENQPRKAKARAVILGYQDKSYEYKQTTSPTLSRSGRQAFLCFCARHHYKVQKGDVSSAFLQGDDLQDDMWVIPTDEICAELGIMPGSKTKLQKAAYGLVEAPLWWYKSVSSFLSSIGYTRMRTEPCIWVYFDETGKPRSIISGHVDDFLFGGSPFDNLHCELMAKIQRKFNWGTWEQTPFIQCGVRITQHEDFGFTLDQEEFCSTLSKINISRDRERQRQSSTTDSEKSQMRAVLGSLSWLCGQVDFLHSADVGFMISTIPHSTVADLVKLNTLVADVQHQHVKLKIHGMIKGEAVDLVAWGDAAWANRPDHSSSTEGVIIGLAPRKLREGKLAPVSLLGWHSTKIDRTARSPACAETHAVVDAEDELYHLRFLWSEMHHSPKALEHLHVDQVAALTPGLTITDSKNLFGKLNKETPVVKSAERRADIEALALKESSNRTGMMLRWVHSDAQLGNSLTKPSEKHQALLFLKMNQCWKITYDEDMTSARRRKTQGLSPMDDK